MGELSRILGEQGERIIIDNFIPSFLGWRGMSNLEIQCNLKNKHQKKTHDIDFFAAYDCPLVSETSQILYCSVKNTLSKNLKSEFKKFAETIAKSSECFKMDSRFMELTKNHSTNKLINSLVLFWVNHDQDNNFDIASEIPNSIGNELDFNFENIYLVSNNNS